MADTKKAHHKQQKICTNRPSYREGRWERAVKVYTVNQESRYVLVFNVPALGVIKDLLELFALYGAIEEYRLLDDYPCEPFTDVYYIKYKEIDGARLAKKKLDNWSFFGHQLHVCYGPEYESVQDTREKLNQRKAIIQEKTKDDHEKNTNFNQSKQTSSMSTSTKTRELTTSTTLSSPSLPPHIPSSEISPSYPQPFYSHPSYSPPCSQISPSQTSLLPPPPPPYPPSSHIPPSTTTHRPPPPPPYPPPPHIPLSINTHLPPLPPPPPPYPPPSQIPLPSHVPSNLSSSTKSPLLPFPPSFQSASSPYPSTIDTTLSSFKSSTGAETKRHSTNSNVDASEGTPGFSHEERVRLFLEQNKIQESNGSGVKRLKTSVEDSSDVISTKITVTNEKRDPIINKRPLRSNNENSDIKIAKTEGPDVTKQSGLLHESLPLTGHKSVDSTITSVRNKMATVFTSFTPASVNTKPKQKKRKRI